VELSAGPPVSDDELTRLAMAADPDAPLDDDAMPLNAYLDAAGVSPLPVWYMPVAVRQSDWRWRRAVVVAVIVAFLAIEASGLCSTYGQLVLG